MKTAVVRMWEYQTADDAVSAACAAHTSHPDARIILVKHVTGVLPSQDGINRVHKRDIILWTVTDRTPAIVDNSKEADEVVQKWDEMELNNIIAQEQAQQNINKGRRQFLPEDVLIRINGVAYKVPKGTEIHGNTDIQWTLKQKETVVDEKSGRADWRVFHNVEGILNRREDDRRNPMPELSEEDKKILLGIVNDPNRIDGYN